VPFGADTIVLREMFALVIPNDSPRFPLQSPTLKER
jgi:hypothetical protein